MNYTLKKELEAAQTLAVSAGIEILKVYKRSYGIEYKKDNSPVTEADKISNALITGELKKIFPEHAILSEEVEDDLERVENPWCWIIDPLDGTKEFIKQNGEFTVNIALAHEHKAVLGVVYVPVIGELYYAVKGNGAYRISNGKTENIHVSEKTDKLTLIISRSHSSEKEKALINNNKEKILKTISTGSSIKGCLIASGEADVYYRFNPTMEWDTAAPHIIAEEAGGIFRELSGAEMLYNRINTKNENGFYILNRIENKLVL
jgi:3'(2'), 5'-bisphosphate nucleotidase